jgi:hypothetical protein
VKGSLFGDRDGALPHPRCARGGKRETGSNVSHSTYNKKGSRRERVEKNVRQDENAEGRKPGQRGGLLWRRKCEPVHLIMVRWRAMVGGGGPEQNRYCASALQP